jgi:Aerotolerance regulator N-terminal
VFAWPTFLNASLLFGAAAFAIPLIIHLLHRTRFTTLEWGAMFFLDDLRRVQTRRIEWQSLLLLLIRCAIPILLALSMARPLLSNRLSNVILSDGHPKLATVIVDNSLSMDALRSDSKEKNITTLDHALERVSSLVRNTSRQTRWSVQSLSNPSGEAFERVYTRDRSVIAESMKRLVKGAGPGNFMDAIDLAVSDMESETEPNARIVVVSDFQKSWCQSFDSNRVQAFRERLNQSDKPPSIVFLQAVEPKSRTVSVNNFCVHIDQQTRSVVGVNQPWEVRVVVKNLGSKDAEVVKCVLVVDDVPMVSKNMGIPAQAESQAVFNLTFPESGSRRIVARIEIADDLITDNEAPWSVLSIGAVPVLIVDPTLGDGTERADSDFLQIALAPFTGSVNLKEDLFEMVRTSPDKLTPDSILKARIIILCDVPELPEALTKSIMDRIQDGGILLGFAGERLMPAWYNDHLFIDSKYQLADKPSKGATNNAGQKLRREINQHPAFRFLNDSRLSGLDSLEITQWYSSTIPVSAKSIHRLLSLNNGDPFLIEQKHGSGSILFCTTTCDDRWTNWPMRPIYLPMVQQLLISQTPADRWASNVETGQTLNLPPKTLVDWLVDARKSTVQKDRDSSETMRFRSGIPVRVASDSVSDSRSIEKAISASHPGFYAIDNAIESPIYASAQAPVSESNLTLESQPELQVFADQFGAKLVGDIEEYEKLGDATGREIWRWVLGLLLVLLFAELLLQRQFVGAKS